jgi:hypothetical protein
MNYLQARFVVAGANGLLGRADAILRFLLKKLFDDSVFQRMKRDNCCSTTAPQGCDYVWQYGLE